MGYQINNKTKIQKNYFNEIMYIYNWINVQVSVVGLEVALQTLTYLDLNIIGKRAQTNSTDKNTYTGQMIQFHFIQRTFLK